MTTEMTAEDAIPLFEFPHTEIGLQASSPASFSSAGTSKQSPQKEQIGIFQRNQIAIGSLYRFSSLDKTEADSDTEVSETVETTESIPKKAINVYFTITVSGKHLKIHEKFLKQRRKEVPDMEPDDFVQEIYLKCLDAAAKKAKQSSKAK